MEVEIPYTEANVPASVLTTTVHYANGGTKDNADLVEKSSDVMTCGGSGSWSSLLSTVALVYYVVTVTTISSDDGDQIAVSFLDINSQNYAKFAPSYALMMRTMQLACLVTAMIGGPLYNSQQGSADVSLTLMFFAIVMATAPFVLLSPGICHVLFRASNGHPLRVRTVRRMDMFYFVSKTQRTFFCHGRSPRRGILILWMGRYIRYGTARCLLASSTQCCNLEEGISGLSLVRSCCGTFQL